MIRNAILTPSHFTQFNLLAYDKLSKIEEKNEKESTIFVVGDGDGKNIVFSSV